MTVLLGGVTLTIFALINYKIYQAKKKCTKKYEKYQVLVSLLMVPHQQPLQCLKITQNSLTLKNNIKPFSTYKGDNLGEFETLCITSKQYTGIIKRRKIFNMV